jgi:aminoglycoside phosphotransferase (APT) family kinase protein
MTPVQKEIQGRLARLYAQQFPSVENAHVRDLVQISDGWENELYAYTVEYGPAVARKREDLVLRIYPGEDAREKSAREFSAMRQLYEVGYPVPQVYHLDPDGGPLGKPFVIMAKIDGRSMGAVAEESPMEGVLALLTSLCRLYVDLHALDWRPFVPDPSLYETQDPSATMGQLLSYFREYAHALGQEAYEPVFDWLQNHLSDVRFERLSVIHFDFHWYNILLGKDGDAYVIDWGAIAVADYRLDLAWTLLLMSTYGHPELREIILREYERIAGCPVEQIEYFDVAACLRRLLTISVSLDAGAGKLGMRPGAEAMMKDLSHIGAVCALLRERTGIRIAETEELLAALSRQAGHGACQAERVQTLAKPGEGIGGK